MYIYVASGEANQPAELLAKAHLHYVPGQQELFYSVCALENRPAPAPAGVPPLTSYTGNYHTEFLHFIVRRTGAELAALTAARRLLWRLEEAFDISPQSLLLYYGTNGEFDIGLPQSLFAGFTPSPNLPQQLGNLSRRVLAATFNLPEEVIQDFEAGLQQQVPPRHFADVVPDFYAPTQMLRAPNSWCAASDTYKVPLHAWELLACSLAELRARASQPRPTFNAAQPYASWPANPRLHALWAEELVRR